jgi:hypothetical protein
MTRRSNPMIVAVMTTGLVLAGCGADESANNAQAANLAATPANDVVASANTTAATAEPGCSAHMAVELDEESLLQAPVDKPITKASLEPFRQAAGARFKEAADELCRQGKFAPRYLKMFTTLILQNGSGATEATFYEDPHEFRSEDFIFQWVFAESNLEVPTKDDIQTGLICWAEPEQEMCAAREP